MARFQAARIIDFRGLNEDANLNALGPEELPDALNCWRDEDRFGTRPGTERETTAVGNYDAAISGTPALQGLFEFLDRNASGNLISVAGGDVRTDDTTILNKTTNSVTISSGADNKWTFGVHRNNLYAAGGADGDHIWRWDGTNPLTVVTFQNSSAAAIDAKFLFSKWNYGFLAGMNGTAVEDNPMVGRYSALNDLDTWPVANTIGGTSAIGGLSSYGNEEITGFGEYTDNQGDWLLVLTNRRIYSFVQLPSALTPFAMDDVIPNGCVHQHAFVSLGLDAGDAVYASNRGIHSLRQSQTHGTRQEQFLSWKIRETYASMNPNRRAATVGAYWPEQGLVIFAISTGSNTTHDTLLALDVRDSTELTAQNARWYIWRLSTITANVVEHSQDASGNRHLYVGTNTGDVVRFTRDLHTDLGVSYTYRWRTKDEDFGRPDLRKGLGDVYVDVGPNGTYTPLVRFRYDYGSRSSAAKQLVLPNAGSNWGTMNWDQDNWASADAIRQNKFYGIGSGFTLSFEFQHSNLDEPLFVYKLAYNYRLIGESSGGEATT